MQENAKDKEILGKYDNTFEIKAIKVFKKSGIWELSIRLKQDLMLTDIKAIEESFITAYNLKGVKINIENWSDLENEDELLSKHWEELKLLAYQSNPSLMGFLKDAELSCTENMAYIKVSNKILADFLHAKKCNEIFEVLTKNYLKLNLKFKIDYKDENFPVDEHYNNLIKEEQKLVSVTMSNTANESKSKRVEDKPPEETHLLLYWVEALMIHLLI